MEDMIDPNLIALVRSWVRPSLLATDAVGYASSSRLPLPACFAAEGCEQPGKFPYSRGLTARGYLDDLWVMGMYSGYASPKETNARFKALLNAGQTGLSIALDLPTQIGVDSDDPLARGEVGKVGVPINTVEDMLTLLDGLPISQIRQMRSTANAIAPIFTAFAVVALEELKIDPSSFRLFLQNDPLKEFPARGTWIFPPAASLRLAVDVIEYFANYHKNWQPIQFCGYHVRDAGGTVVQEVGVAIANGLAYIEEAIRRGVRIVDIAPTLFFFLSSGIDVFEEAAKFRAARRLWARLLRERYGLPAEMCGIRIFAYTLGGALVAKEPQNNITRIAYEALAAVLGGVQTLATSSWDEAHSLPSEQAAHLSLRTQQILAHESGVAKVVDPLGGSYYVEALTDCLESEIAGYVADILEQGGAVAAIESGFIEDELSNSAFRDFQDLQSGRRLIVGVNLKAQPGGADDDISFSLSSRVAEEAISELRRVKAGRNERKVRQMLEAIRDAASNGRNTIPALIDAVRERATIGEMTQELASIFGRHASPIGRDVVSLQHKSTDT